MSYTKNTWATGDEITAAKLNNLEDGVEAAAAAADKVQIEVLPKQTIDGWTGSGSVYVCTATGKGVVAPIPGESYAVLWDGKEYICKCYDKLEAGGIVFNNARILGNGSIGTNDASVDTGEPFFMFEGYGDWHMFTKEAGDSHKVGVKLAPPVNVEQIKATADDEGKFLKVVDGKPAWVAISQAETASF